MRLVIIGAALGLAACSSGKSSTNCRDDNDCPPGQRCGIGSLCEPVPADWGPEVGPDLGPLPEAAPELGAPMDARPADTAPGWPDQAPTPDAVAAPDLPPPDVGVPLDGLPALSCAAVIGNPCTSGGAECGSQATCLVTASGNKGVCTCACTPDDPLTPLVDEDDCPGSGTQCGDVLLSSGAQANYCFKACSPKLNANDCQGGLACDPGSGAAVGLYGLSVCAFYGCLTGADCPVVTATACNTASPTSCAAGEQCLAAVSGSTDGYCAKPGSCELVSGLCGPHSLGKSTAKVGDPCTDDTQCAGTMRCLMQIDWSTYRKKGGQSCQDDTECCSGACQLGSCTAGLCTVDFRNGYCTVEGCAFAATLTSAACPTGSTCNILYGGGMCQKTCSLSVASGCRGQTNDLLGDYECRSWDNLTLGGKQIAAAPVCDFGPRVDCAIFGASSTLDCTDLGDATNSTKMTCRGLDNSARSNAHDPTGFCLDDTASGTQLRSPLPTP